MVSQPIYILGAGGAETLRSHMQNSVPPELPGLASQLLMRDSVGKPPLMPPPSLAPLLYKYIWHITRIGLRGSNLLGLSQAIVHRCSLRENYLINDEGKSEMSEVSVFADEQSAAVQRAARLILEKVDFAVILEEAGVDLTGADTVTIEFEGSVDSDGVMKKKPGDGKGCVTVCVNIGVAKFCWKNCDG